jgi:hypothetical protein
MSSLLVPPLASADRLMTSAETKVCQEAPSTELVAVSTGYHSPVSVLGSGRVDPFGCFPIEMSPYMNFLVDYCK